MATNTAQTANTQINTASTSNKVFTIDDITIALEELVPLGIPLTHNAIGMLYAIGMQESLLIHRYQIPQPTAINRKGPARGLWQFECMGGVKGVLTHRNTKAKAEALCRKYVGSLNEYAVWNALEYEDGLACCLARLLLWSDPKTLPDVTSANMETAWNYYLRNWRPGSPKPATWTGHWNGAVSLVRK